MTPPHERSVLLIGGGGHAAVVAESVFARGWRIAGFLDDDPETEEGGSAIGMMRLGTIGDLPRVLKSLKGDVIVHAATGNAALRRRWLRSTPPGIATDPFVHPSAVVSPTARIGEGTFIGPRAVVNARAIVGRGVIINTGAIVEHDCSIGDFAHVAPGSVLAGGAHVGEDALVGCGSVVLPGVAIGRGATLGAGAVAVTDVEDGVTAVGAPARAIGLKSGV